MENSKEKFIELLEAYKDLTAYQLGNYVFLYPTELNPKKYSDKDFSGIIFETDDCRYDVCNNYAMGYRLIINPVTGGFRDIPFKSATFGFLPECIIVKEIG